MVKFFIGHMLTPNIFKISDHNKVMIGKKQKFITAKLKKRFKSIEAFLTSKPLSLIYNKMTNFLI